MNLIDLITGNTGNQVAKEAENKFGISKGRVIALLAVAAPLVISYLKNKSQDAKEAEALNNALERDHNGSILNNPTTAVARQEEGNSILDHIFGTKKATLENQLSQNTGISMDKIGPILAMLAPIIMGYIGNEKKQGGVQSGGGLSDLLGGILGNANQQAKAENTNPINDILGGILGNGGSSPESGNPLESILGSMLGGGDSKQQGGLGGLLGGLLGRK